MFDLTPATETLSRVVESVGEDQLADPTPCAGMSVADLLDHIDGLALAFTAAAGKTPAPGTDGPPQPDGSRLTTEWRSRIPDRLAALSQAWLDERAWEGMTQAGGVDLPAEVAAMVATNEIIVHGWDLATATDQPFAADPGLLAAAHGFVEASVAENPDGTPGLFGPPVPTPEDAGSLDRLIGLTGRDGSWRP